MEKEPPPITGRPLSSPAEVGEPETTSLGNFPSTTQESQTGRSAASQSVQHLAISSPDDRSPSSQDPALQPRSRGTAALLIFALCFSTFLAALDITIITTALPTIAADLEADQTGYTWIGSTYLLAGAGIQPIWGSFSDIFGRKPILLLANAVFLAGSVVCATAPNLAILIVGRTIQGVGSGGLLNLVSIVIGDLFSQRERSLYYGLMSFVWAIANTSGPFLGGLFSSNVTWRWCFWVNVPCDGLALIITALFLHVHNPKTPLLAGLAAIDWLGCFTLIGGTVLLLLGLELGGVTYPWASAPVLSLTISGIFISALFFFLESRATYPLLPLHMLRRLSNLAALAVTASHSLVFIAASYFLPLYFQSVLGTSPLKSGIYLFPFVTSLSLTSVATGLIINRTGSYRPLITSGMALMTLGFLLFISFGATTNWAQLILYQLIAGAGVGPNFQSPMLALHASAREADMAGATSAIGLVRQLSNTASVVLGAVIFQAGMSSKRHALLRSGLNATDLGLFTGGSAASVADCVGSLPVPQRDAVRAAYASSLSRMWILYVGIGIVGLGLTDWVGRAELSARHEEARTGLDARRAANAERWRGSARRGCLDRNEDENENV